MGGCRLLSCRNLDPHVTKHLFVIGRWLPSGVAHANLPTYYIRFQGTEILIGMTLVRYCVKVYSVQDRIVHGAARAYHALIG